MFKARIRSPYISRGFIIAVGGGRNVDDQNVDRPKISERRNGLFSWSERRNQNVEMVFLVDQNVEKRIIT